MAIASLSFSANQSQKIILIAMTTVAIVTIIEQVAKPSDPASTLVSVSTRVFVGAFVASAILLLFSYVLPEFAVGLAVVTAVGVVLTKGQPFWDAINTVVGKAPNPTPALPLQNQINQEKPTGTFNPLPAN